MFKTEKKHFGDNVLINLLNELSGEFVTINVSFGGAINQIGLRKNDELIELLDTYISPEKVKEGFMETYKGAKLFPFPNMVKNGQYSFKEIAYQLPLNWVEDGHAIHGFVADKPFKIMQELTTENEASVTLGYNHTGSEGYPFPFKLTIKYLLNDNGFTATTSVFNTGSYPLPLGDGWHPYFNLQDKVDDIYLRVSSSAIVEIDEHFIPTGNMIENKENFIFNKIGTHHFDTCFQLDHANSIAVTTVWNKHKNVGVDVWQQTGEDKYNYVLIYTPPGRKSIAIEPMTCQPDAFNNYQHLIVLQPSAVFEASFGVQLF